MKKLSKYEINILNELETNYFKIEMANKITQYLKTEKNISLKFIISILYKSQIYLADEISYLCLEHLNKEDLYEHFDTFCFNGWLPLVKKIVDKFNYNPSIYKNRAIIKAANNYQIETVKYLSKIDNVDITAQNNQVFINLCGSIGDSNEYYKISYLLELYKNENINPYDQNGQALINVISRGREDLIHLFINDKEFTDVVNKRKLLQMVMKKSNSELLIKFLNEKKYLIELPKYQNSLLKLLFNQLKKNEFYYTYSELEQITLLLIKNNIKLSFLNKSYLNFFEREENNVVINNLLLKTKIQEF
jgi:hypothetical protein